MFHHNLYDVERRQFEHALNISFNELTDNDFTTIQAGTILFPLELLGEMGDPLRVISTRDSLLFRMRFSRLFFVYLLNMAA